MGVKRCCIYSKLAENWNANNADLNPQNMLILGKIANEALKLCQNINLIVSFKVQAKALHACTSFRKYIRNITV